MELAPYLCYHLDFLLDFFTEDKSYQYLQDASSLPCYLITVLSKLSPNIRKYWKFSIPHGFFQPEVTSQLHLHTSEGRRKVKMANFIWRIGKFSNILTLISQHSYQISSQMRWHPLAPDKTLLQ